MKVHQLLIYTAQMRHLHMHWWSVPGSAAEVTKRVIDVLGAMHSCVVQFAYFKSLAATLRMQCIGCPNPVNYVYNGFVVFTCA